MITYSYQWKWADTNANIFGATNPTYTLVSGDVGHTIKCAVTASGANGSASADSNTTAAVTAGADWYVDSVSGSDSNAGTSISAPFQSLAKLNAMVVANPAKKTVALKRGSYWRDLLGVSVLGDPNAWPSGSKVTDYGSGACPVIDGADVASNGSFSLASGQTSTYQISWAHSLPAFSGKEFFSAWENGVRLKRATSIANCEATAGSCYAPDPTGTSPQLIYIHATDSSDLSANGRIYEITARLYAVGFGGVNGVILGSSTDGTIGLRARRGGANNGSIEVGRDVTLKGVISQEGRLHNFLIGSGTAIDCYSWKLERGAGGTGWVAFGTDGTGLSMNWVRCYHVGDTSDLPSDEAGFYGHTLSAPFSSFSYTDCFAYYCFSGFDGLAESVSLNRCGTDQVLIPVSTGTNLLSVDDGYFRLNSPYGGSKAFAPAGLAGTVSNNRIEFVTNFQYGFWGSGTWTINNNTIINTVSGYGDIIHPNGTSTIDFSNNITQGCHNLLNTSDGTLTLGAWNNNDYHDDGGGQFWTYNANPFANGLAAWKTLSGKEASSISSDPLFAGSPSSGDFTLQGGSPAIALSAGATNDPTKGRWAMPVWSTVVATLVAA